MSAFLQDLLQRLPWSLPYFGVQIYGVWVCTKYSQNSPELSKRASFAFILFGVTNLLSILKGALFATVLTTTSLKGISTWGLSYASASAVLGVLNLLAWLLLLRGIYRTLQPNHGRLGV